MIDKKKILEGLEVKIDKDMDVINTLLNDYVIISPRGEVMSPEEDVRQYFENFELDDYGFLNIIDMQDGIWENERGVLVKKDDVMEQL